MRALHFDGQSVRLLTAAADPPLAPGEALVHPTRLLIGAPDLAAGAPGCGRTSPGVLGHQFVGVVKKIAPLSESSRQPLHAARHVLLNKRVVGSPLIACAQCDLCRAGLPGHCRTRRVMGLFERDGCFADVFAIPLANLCAVPDNLPDDVAVFAHVASSAVQTVQMLRAASRHYITVLGDNALALATAQVLGAANKSTRVLFTRPDIARLCERWGIRHRAASEPGRRQDQDVVVDCTGTAESLTLAMQLVRPRGVIMLKSPAAGQPLPLGRPWPINPAWASSSRSEARAAAAADLTPLITNEVQVLGCRDASIADGLGALADGRIDAASLISRRFKFDDAPAALAAAASPDSLAVIMDV